MVPGLGVEPRRARGPRDFKSLASTVSATPALGDSTTVTGLSVLTRPPPDAGVGQPRTRETESGSGSSGRLCRRRHRESALAHQGCDSGIPAAEVAIVLGGVDRVFPRQKVVDEALRGDLFVRTSGLPARLPGLGREGVGP